MSFRIGSLSSGNWYKVDLRREGELAYLSCSCPAGMGNIHCKHRIALICGDGSEIIEATHEVDDFIKSLEDTGLVAAVHALRNAEVDLLDAEGKLKAARQKVSKIMHGQN